MRLLFLSFYTDKCSCKFNPLEFVVPKLEKLMALKDQINGCLIYLVMRQAGLFWKLEVGVKTVKPDDHVVAHWRKGSGIDAESPVYDWEDKKVNAGAITTFSEFAIISENRLTKVAHSTDPETSALLADTLTTGFGIINNDAKVKNGESIVIIGSGGIGLGAILGASLVNAYPIIAVDLHEHKLDLQESLGLHTP